MEDLVRLVIQYLIFLMFLLAITIGWVIYKRLQNDWLQRKWAGKQRRFQTAVEQYITGGEQYSPRMKSALGGLFGRWALNYLMDLSEHIKGKDLDRFGKMITDWGLCEEVGEWLEDARWWRRLEGIHLVGAFYFPQHREKVKQMLKDPHPIIRMKAFQVLCEIGQGEDLADLLNLLDRGVKDWYQLDQVVFFLEKLDLGQGEVALEKILPHYKASKNPFVRRILAELIGSRVGKDGIPFLLGNLKDPEPEVRIGILKTLIDLKAYSALPNMLELLKWSESPGVKIIAAKGIAILGGNSYLSVMAENLGHSLWWVRYYCAWGLAQLGGEGKQELKWASRQHPDPYARQMARYVMQLQSKEEETWRLIETSLQIQ